MGRPPNPTFRTCDECGHRWKPRSDLYTRLCGSCRQKDVQPSIDLLRVYQPCCREAYVRGILSYAVKSQDQDSIRTLGAILDKLREEGET